jgi:hypothetical protein
MNDGGPAFPHDGQQNYTGGMSLRDYFAAKAMQAALVNANAGSQDGINQLGKLVAQYAYLIADAMLEARK